MNHRTILRASCSLAAVLAAFCSGAAELELEIGTGQTFNSISAQMDSKVRAFARNLSILSRKQRATQILAGRGRADIPFSMPATLYLTRQGQRLGESNLLYGDGGSGIVLQFDATGPRSFPLAYRQLLEDTFAEAQSTMVAVFGVPAFGGTVHVRNFDADIGDRDAVAGGYYVPDNGSAEQEIRFPEYSNNEAAAVNFVHCLLLAHMGGSTYGFDAFREGLVRAAAMRVARTAGAMPAGLDPGLIESVLESTYDVGTHYDWYNQRGLGGTKFIAPNLLNTQLPAGGSLGGVYLLRYQMAGSAWQKALVEYPAFASTLNAAVYAQPSLLSDIPGLITKSQEVIDSLFGSAGATLEGRSFAEWFKRQFILHTQVTLGQKLICHPIPLPPIPSSPDFGVFDVPVTWFETLPGGNEILLSGTSYPIFWGDLFDRIFPSSQEDRMDIAGAYGSVTPNIPNFYAGEPFRTVIDIPVQDKITRVIIPAGAIATGSNPTPNDFYGTFIGTDVGALRVRLTHGVTVVDNIPITHGAFEARIDTPAYLNSNRCKVEVIRTISTVETVLLERFFNKGPGPIALDLRLDFGDAGQSFGVGIPKGLSTAGLSVDPFSSSISETLGIAESQVLVARWNGSKARYDIAPDTGMLQQGMGYFLRLPNVASVTIPGRTSPNTPIAVALRPGWNLISNPTSTTLTTDSIRVIHAADTPKPWSEAVGADIGTAFFTFSPGPNDAATSAPETGTMIEATQFNPGNAYFIRVLIAEGVSLLFTPPSAFNRISNSNAVVPSIPKYVMRVRAGRQGHSTQVLLGQSSTATSSFDPREDSGLPPGTFGLQAAIVGNAAYRDIRAIGATQTFNVRFDGLQPAKIYELRTDVVQGRLAAFSYRKVGQIRWNRMTRPLRTFFRADSSTENFQFQVTGQ